MNPAFLLTASGRPGPEGQNATASRLSVRGGREADAPGAI